MYANLKVTVEGRDEPIMAWRVGVALDGSVYVDTDENDGESRAVMGEQIIIPSGAGVIVEANF